MNKFLNTIHSLYNKILPIAEKSGVELNLDYADPATVEIDVEADDPKLKAELEEEIKNAITRTNSGNIKIKVANGAVTISDTGTVLSRPLCESLSHGRVKVKSRVGFGTSIDISLTDKPEVKTSTQDKTQPSSIKKPTKPARITATNESNQSTKPTKKH